MDNELKPCPFCNGETIDRIYIDEKWQTYTCRHCEARGQIAISKADALWFWNNRPTEVAATAAERARVLALVDDWAKSVPADDDDYVFIFRELRAAIESGEQPPEAH